MSQPYEHTDPRGAKELIDAHGAVVVDVRTEAEFDSGHIPGSYNIPVGFGVPPALTPNKAFAETVARLFPADTKLVFV